MERANTRPSPYPLPEQAPGEGTLMIFIILMTRWGVMKIVLATNNAGKIKELSDLYHSRMIFRNF
jgi:hypothetical protein